MVQCEGIVSLAMPCSTLRYHELTLFFPAGGELATEEVLESSDASCRIIEFESAEGNSIR